MATLGEFRLNLTHLRPPMEPEPAAQYSQVQEVGYNIHYKYRC